MSSLELLVWLGQMRSGLADAIFIGASALGSEEAYLALLTIVYLCIDHRFGFRLLAMFALSVYCNAQLKMAFGFPRPYEVFTKDLHPLYQESATGASFPSGHAQNAVVVWGIIATRCRSWLWRGVVVAVIAVVSFSRLYCQVHWPVDVAAGLIIGVLLVGGYLAFLYGWRSWGKQLEPGVAVIAVLAIAGLMYLFSQQDQSCVRSSGGLLGFGLGYVLLEARGYKATAPWGSQVVKVAVALALLLALRSAGRVMLGESAGATALNYAVVGFTAAYLLPVLFAKCYTWGLYIRGPIKRQKKTARSRQQQTGTEKGSNG